MFKIKARYYLELWQPGMINLLWSIKSKITKDENGESVPHFEINEVVLVHYNNSNRLLNCYTSHLQLLRF